jgi:hypothetical protein
MKFWLFIAAYVQISLASPAWENGSGFRVAPLRIPAAGHDGFQPLVPEQTGIRFTNILSDAALAKNQILEVGSGVALGDVDRDGWVDIYFCSISGGNRLYRNLGNWKFEDITTDLIACAGQASTGAVFADVDGDSNLDLLVNGIGAGTRLFLNDGKGHFQEASNSGLIRQHGSTSMALADMDGNGTLDLYVANYHTRTFKDSPPGLNVQAGYVGGKFVINPPGLFLPLFLKTGGVNLFERGESDLVYLNDGKGKFTPISWTNGTFMDAPGKPLAEAPKDWGLAVAFRDLNGDGAPDLYVCNDFFNSPDRVWLNDGFGKFHAAPSEMLRHISMSSMSVAFADINRDGLEDFMVLDMMSREHERRHRQRGSQIHLQVPTPTRDPVYQPEYPRNTLFLNRGDGTYAEVAQYCGLEASEWSWSVVFIDVDLDGFEDVLITNGNARDANDADLAKSKSAPGKPRFPPLMTANLAFRNKHDLTFEECGTSWGFDHVGISHGMALADLDNDGDLDVVVNNMREPAGVYRNETIAPRVGVRLIGIPPNIQGIGAKVELRGGAVPIQSQEVASGGRYASGDDPMLVFAPGSAKQGMTLKVTWRNGNENLVETIRPNCLYEVYESGAKKPAGTSASVEQPFFEDVSARLKHPHQENEFNDFDRQPTLSRGLSRLGPGILWRDLDGDGWEDLVVGGAKDGYSVVYLNDRAGGFKPLRRREPLQQDQSTLLALSGPDGSVELLAGSSNYETASRTNASVVRYDLQRGTESSLISAQPWSVGPLALGHRGKQLALFAGGRALPGQYPRAVPSQLYIREKEGWKSDVAASSALGTNLISGATWADLDQDGQAELVVASDWGPIRIYQWQDGALREMNLGLAKYRGLWNGVATGDFDSDGRLDIVASNWGRNTPYQRHRVRPLRLYYGEWQAPGRIQMIEAYYEPGRGRYAPFTALDKLRAVCPVLAEKFTSFAAYANSSIDEIVPPGPLFLEANWFETTLFLNRGDHFEPRPLPPEAQFAPAFGLSVGDFDGDGNEDLFLSQNFFDVDLETARYDAGRGLWLRGDGKGNLDPVPGQLSGVRLYGEQRGCSLADFDHDGRIDLAVGQNNGPTALFRNVHAKPGIRVRLEGSSWNRDAIGATIRLKWGNQYGPTRAVQIGSGYWSQESIVQVMAAPVPPTAVWVRWPGGRVSETLLQPNQREIAITEARLAN